jgi:hypothetical protein
LSLIQPPRGNLPDEGVRKSPMWRLPQA